MKIGEEYFVLKRVKVRRRTAACFALRVGRDVFLPCPATVGVAGSGVLTHMLSSGTRRTITTKRHH